MESASAFEELTKVLLRETTENGRVGVLTAMKLIKDHLGVDGHLTQAAYVEEEKISALINQTLSLDWNQ